MNSNLVALLVFSVNATIRARLFCAVDDEVNHLSVAHLGGFTTATNRLFASQSG